MTKNTSVTLFWFRQDLRLEDNPGLVVASENSFVVPIYIAEEATFSWMPGSASNVWLYHSLRALNESLEGSLRFFRGNPQEILVDIMKIYGANSIVWNRLYDKRSIERDSNIKNKLGSLGYDVKSFNSALLWEPWEVLKEDNTPYRVFTPFYRKGCLNARKPRSPLKIPKIETIPVDKFCGLSSLNSLKLLKGKVWEDKIGEKWEIGEEASLKKCQFFLENGIKGYKEKRNFPARQNVSILSPHLHFGEISINKVWFLAKEKLEDKNYNSRDIDHFLSELGWREFSYSLLFNNPDLPEINLQKRFDNFPWSDNAEFFNAWKRGATGFPIVDAGMRQLYDLGYMHNRLRMIVGSFLVKNLLIDWRKGQQWFWECLVDADIANNSAGWQWIAGCGADAAPYFRIFNPITQAQKFDTDGVFIRRFVPEISKLPNDYIYQPFNASPEILKKADIVLGKDYPHPIIDLSASRIKALEAFAKTKL